jgi:hypothetical protein
MLPKAWQTLVEEAFAPQANNVASDGESGGDGVIGPTFGGVQDDAGAQNLKIWQRIPASPFLEDLALAPGEHDGIWASSRHLGSSMTGAMIGRLARCPQQKYVAIFMPTST